jgi:xanthosine utilization system XapX-like protein
LAFSCIISLGVGFLIGSAYTLIKLTAEPKP